MKSVVAISALSSLVLSACSSTLPCEDILEVKRQAAVCKRLAVTMNKTGYPQQALTARKRYEAECEELRYYRDEFDTICKGDQKPIGETRTKDKSGKNKE